MTPAFTASLLVLATLLLVLPTRGRGLHRLTPRTSPAPSRRLFQRWLLAPPIGLALFALGTKYLISALAIAAITWLILSQRAQHHRRKAATTRRTQIIEALDILAADLTAGRPPVDALEGAATACPDFHIAHAAARLGGDVPGALDLAAESPGATGLRALAAAWRVAEESGAAFAALTERLAEFLRADEALHRQTAASLAGARSTARILALLPVFGIVLGYSLGARPLSFLTETPIGWLCLAAGLGLTAVGLHWTTRLAEVNP
ncbi:type II secretion system protein [Kribbella turkmenica]|uniref:Type II secretion system protein n=1 Tax=Kribbella turkmenica TaxID=2530375 RepID=A0A4R4W8Q8_9ACTN|nr:type II secretion system F family protein [Kribbella turkmenica]TDD15112.1 type II secretion system protein [Kribbella turkmenica]